MANEVEKLQFGDEVFEIQTPNNAEIIIKQGGVEKGRFTVNASEPVEINLDAGGSSDDCVKKTGDTMSGDLVMTDGNPLERSVFGLEVKKTEVTGRRLDYGTSFNVSDDGTFNFLYKSNPSDNITSFGFQQKLVRCFVSQSSTEEKNGAALFIGDYSYSASERALLAIRKIEYNARFTPGIYANFQAIWWGVYDGVVKPIYLGPDGDTNVIYTDGDVQIRQNKAGATGGYEVVHSLANKADKSEIPAQHLKQINGAVTNSGWYQCAYRDAGSDAGAAGNLGDVITVALTRTYNNLNNESYYINVCISYMKGQIVLLNNCKSEQHITQFRITRKGRYVYLEFYYNITSNNSITVQITEMRGWNAIVKPAETGAGVVSSINL